MVAKKRAKKGPGNIAGKQIRKQVKGAKTESKPVKKEKVSVSAFNPKPQSSLRGIMKELQSLKTEVSDLEKEAAPMAKGSMRKPMEMENGDSLAPEEVAVRLTRLYFEEIARLGFKRRLDFDAIINAYYYCLQRLQNKEKELEIMRKVVEREENKLSGESKTQLFPEM